jgi:hypothetical protein
MDGKETPGLAVSQDRSPESVFAIWPPDAAGRMAKTPDLEDLVPGDEERAQLAAVTGQPPAALHVWQRLELDLDGDKRPDKLTSMYVLDGDGVVTYGALLVTAPDEEPRVILMGNTQRYTVLAHGDLEGDGAPELILDGSSDDGSHLTVTRLVDGSLTNHGGWNCGL